MVFALCVGCNAKDNDPAVVKIVECEETEISLYVYEEQDVTVNVLPVNADDKEYYWEIEDKTIATVSGNTFVGLKPGETKAVVFNTIHPEIKDSLKIIVMEYPHNKNISYSDENITYEGRVVLDGTSAQYFYPGSSISVNFTGTTLYGVFNKVVAYYWVEIDDEEPFKLFTRSKANWIDGDTFCLAKNLKPGIHSAKITLCSEGIFKKPMFYGFVIDDSAEVVKPAEKTTKFEFIGNSITCGYGTEVTDRSPFNDSTSNFCHGFAYLTAKAFNAELMVVARSGIGVYRNYGDDESASEYGCLPDNYEKLWLESSKTWDFSKFSPNVVFVNLGTNDTWDCDNDQVKESTFSDEKFDEKYRSLIDKIYSHYTNNPKLVLLTGSMMASNALSHVKPILDKIQSDYSAKGHSVYRFDFAPTMGTGADWHPCAAQQKKMGESLIAFLKENNIVE